MAAKEVPWQCSIQLGILGLQGSHVLRRSLLLGPRLLRSLLLLLLVLLPAKRGHLRTCKCRRAAS